MPKRAAVKAIRATQDMPKERFAQLIQREANERAEKVKSGTYKTAELFEEANARERRLGMPVTDLTPK